MLSKTFWTAKRYAAAATTRRNRLRAQLFAKRLRLRALWARVDLDLQIAGDAIIGRRLRLELEPGTRAALVLGPRSVIRDDVTILLRGGGELRLGADGELRSHCLLNLRGPFVLGPGCIVSWYSVIHCGESVTFGSYVGLAERVTVADSTHYFTEPDVFFYQNTRHAPVSIGHNTWLAPGATVTAGARIGQHCIIGANTVVGNEVPDGHVVTGGKPVARKLRLPWEQALRNVQNGSGAESVAVS